MVVFLYQRIVRALARPEALMFSPNVASSTDDPAARIGGLLRLGWMISMRPATSVGAVPSVVLVRAPVTR